MRTRCLVAVLAACLLAAGAASAATIQLVDIWTSNVHAYNYFAVGKGIEIAWLTKGVPAEGTVKIELLKNGAPFRTLASGFPVAKSAETNSEGQLWGYWVWSPGPAAGDTGCFDSFRVTVEPAGPSATTQNVGIFDAWEFKDSSGTISKVRLDSPNGGVLVKGQTATISWTVIPYFAAVPSGSVKLELYYQNAKVGDIAEVPVIWRACPMRGQYSWTVGQLAAATNAAMAPDGKSAMAGNFYRVRVSVGGGGYLGSTFVIALTSGMPKPAGTPLHKVTPGPGTIKD